MENYKTEIKMYGMMTDEMKNIKVHIKILKQFGAGTNGPAPYTPGPHEIHKAPHPAPHEEMVTSR